MNINVRLMREGEVVRQVDQSTLIAEEGQVMLSIEDGKSIAAVLLEPSAATNLGALLQHRAKQGELVRYYNLSGASDRGHERIPNCVGSPAPRSLWALLFGGRK